MPIYRTAERRRLREEAVAAKAAAQAHQSGAPEDFARANGDDGWQAVEAAKTEQEKLQKAGKRGDRDGQMVRRSDALEVNW